MSTARKSLQEMMRELPPDDQTQVRNFVEFLLAKRGRHSTGTLQQGWAGALRKYRKQYTSLELQRQSLEWRGD